MEARQQLHKIEAAVEDEFLHMDSDLQQAPDDQLAWVYPILGGPVHRQQVLVVRSLGNSDYGQQREEEDCCDVLDLGGFGNVQECLLLHRSRRREWKR